MSLPGHKGGHFPPPRFPQPREVAPPASRSFPLVGPHGRLFTPRTRFSGRDVFPLRWGLGSSRGAERGRGRRPAEYRRLRGGVRVSRWLPPCGWKGVTPWGGNALSLGVLTSGGDLPEPPARGEAGVSLEPLRRGGWFFSPSPSSLPPTSKPFSAGSSPLGRLLLSPPIRESCHLDH